MENEHIDNYFQMEQDDFCIVLSNTGKMKAVMGSDKYDTLPEEIQDIVELLQSGNIAELLSPTRVLH